MSTLVIYDSVHGNTEKIALAVGAALGARTARVGEVSAADLQGVDLLLVGSPTQAFNPLPSVKAFVAGLPAGALAGVRAEAFDTRLGEKSAKQSPGILKFMANLFGYAADKLERQLKGKGAQVIGKPGQFCVDDTEGPLSLGELERAGDWARAL
ncbi:MAG: flavodoxin family protein [Anaerolineae bacterium]